MSICLRYCVIFLFHFTPGSDLTLTRATGGVDTETSGGTITSFKHDSRVTFGIHTGMVCLIFMIWIVSAVGSKHRGGLYANKLFIVCILHNTPCSHPTTPIQNNIHMHIQ